MHYLLEEGLHKEVNELLIERLPKYFRVVDRSREQDLRHGRAKLKKMSYIPNSHMEMYTRSLMLQVGREAKWGRSRSGVATGRDRGVISYQ